MKVISLMLVLAGTLVITASCGNRNNEATAKTPQMQMAMSDTSKFSITMVDYKKDPVCGMPLTAGIGDTAHYNGKVYGFCSKECKDNFLKDPKSYLPKEDKQ
jgi:YHS domain-containing protein